MLPLGDLCLPSAFAVGRSEKLWQIDYNHSHSGGYAEKGKRGSRSRNILQAVPQLPHPHREGRGLQQHEVHGMQEPILLGLPQP